MGIVKVKMMTTIMKNIDFNHNLFFHFQFLLFPNNILKCP